MIEDEFEEYKQWVNSIESCYKYGLKSININYLDGITFSEWYSKIFSSNEYILKQRNRYRTPFQLERDRILYSPLLIRLSEKTQLFTSEKGFKENRLTHTIKVVQIARSIGRGLQLNEDLIEAMAWGHDIGHPPFGHIGEEALNEWIGEKVTQEKGQETLLIHDQEEAPLLNRVQDKYKESFKRYFIFGSDPNEDFFMHGRQSFRLLAFKRKPEKREHLRFTKSVMYGIWRHSTSNSRTDDKFKFEKTVNDKKITLSGKEDVTLETYVVRYADNIAWIISDLTEGLRKNLISTSDLTSIIESIEDSSIENLDYLLKNGKLEQLYTFFISDFINTNLEKIERKNDKKVSLTFSDINEEVFNKFKTLIKEKIHRFHYLSRGCNVNKSRVKALCEWYFNNSDSFLKEFSWMQQRRDFPIQIPVIERLDTNYTEYAIYKDLLSSDLVYRISVIVDFVSALTDVEVCMLSETMPYYRLSDTTPYYVD
jgi:predicted deoxyguanosinetriphosphate triphosphohydrolase